MLEKRKEQLLNSETFCVLPWIHAHTWPNGNVYPCCAAPMQDPFGSTATTNLIEIWNNDRFKNMRSKLMKDERVSTCKVCYKVEEYNAGVSMRMGLNHKFIDSVIPLLDKTTEDGHLSEMNLLYWDYRFSNLCNLKCRTCGPDLSSSWASDHEKMNNYIRPVTFIKDQTLLENLDIMIDQNIDLVEEIYFAGGEPLLMPEHLKIINRLVESGRAKDVRLRYSTNMSTLTFKGTDFNEVWPLFKEVIVGVSLDEVGDRAEYWRAGTDWERMKRNLVTLSETTKKHPNVRMPFYPVLSIFNMHRMYDICKELSDLGVLHSNNQVWFNILNEPSYYNFEIAPPELKEMARVNLIKMKELFEELFKDGGLFLFPISDTIDGTLNRLNIEHSNAEYERKLFVEVTNKLDGIRNEKFEFEAPELYKILFDQTNK